MGALEYNRQKAFDKSVNDYINYAISQGSLNAVRYKNIFNKLVNHDEDLMDVVSSLIKGSIDAGAPYKEIYKLIKFYFKIRGF